MKKEIMKLLANLRIWNYMYRIGDPIISDAEYDEKLEIFKTEHPNHPYVLEIEPAPIDNNRKQKLPIQMRSLDKIKNIPDLKKWFIKNGVSEEEHVVLGAKLDGASLLDDNHTGAAFSRGGEENEGQRCDAHRKLIKAPYSNDVRFSAGEVIISRANWKAYWEDKINPRTGEKYKTLRGVVVGLIRDDIPKEEVKYVDYIKYFTPELDYLDYDDQLKVLNRSNNVKSVFEKVRVGGITEELLLDLYTKWNIDYEVDGIVININNAERRKKLGRHTRSGNPKYAVAYKGDFEERLETTVKHLNVNISKQGYLVPTVALDMVVLSGAEIKNPTGYNFRWIFDNNIAEGSRVVVKRSGSVIPKLIKTMSFNEFTMQTLADFYAECPVCGSSTAWTINDKGEHINLMCTNKDCKGKRLAEIVAFFEIMKFEDFGEGAITKMFDAGYDTLPKMFEMKAGEIININGLGESIANTFMDQLAKLRTEGISLAKLAHASNKFSGLGSTKLQLIFDNINDQIFFDISKNKNANIKDVYELTSVNGLAEKSIEIFINGWVEFSEWVENIHIPISYIKAEVTDLAGDLCVGFNVCFSGIRDKALEVFISGEGGTIKGGVSKKLTHLIVADPSADTKKIREAKSFGCQILTIKQFKNL